LEKGGERGNGTGGQGGQATGITIADREKWRESERERKGIRKRRSEC